MWEDMVQESNNEEYQKWVESLTPEEIQEMENEWKDENFIMDLSDFIQQVNMGIIGMDDGVGYYVDKNNKVTNISCEPNMVWQKTIDFNYNKMAWFPK